MVFNLFRPPLGAVPFFHSPFRPTNIAVVVPSLGQSAPAGVWRLGARFPASTSRHLVAPHLRDSVQPLRGSPTAVFYVRVAFAEAVGGIPGVATPPTSRCLNGEQQDIAP